jgi:hypothetical protein
MLKIDIPDAIPSGTKVFIQLGSLTVKHGLVVGHRVTLASEKPEIEYLVRWFGAGGREPQEWRISRETHTTSDAAFRVP